VRDIFDAQVTKILCDNEAVARRIRDFVGIVQPRLRNRVVLHDGKTPLFHRYNLEKEISRFQSKRVDLKSGGSIVIEPTEAMVAIDVNSGRYRKQDNAEQTALKINLEAAVEIVRQLRLRDLGGLIVCDFIDMRESKNRRAVEKAFRDALKEDRARSHALRMSAFGLIELTRQRLRPSFQSGNFLECPTCRGTGVVKTLESLAIEVLRQVTATVARQDVARVEVKTSADVADYLLNQRRAAVVSLETQAGKSVFVHPEPGRMSEAWELACYNARGSRVSS